MSGRVFLLLIVLHVAAGAAFLSQSGPGFPLDDTWVHMVYARAFGQGDGFAYNPGQLETGISSPLWTTLLALPVALSDLAGLRRRMGYVFQEAALINWLTVAENLALPLEETTDLESGEIADRVAHPLGLVHIPDAADRFPGQISGGMKKRVGLARALITEPEIVLYDEPNAGLDPEIARSINALADE